MKKTSMAVAVLSVAGAAFGQGTLTPPGAPAPTMKTLDEIHATIELTESRTPISQAGTTIDTSGSYYLTTNLVPSGSASGLSISADNVTVDLNGFSIMAATAISSGIILNNHNNILIRNGTIRDAYYFGIAALNSTDCQFENLRIIGNGRYSTYYDGLHAGTNSTITACTAGNNGGAGIYAGFGSTITACTASFNGEDGIFAKIGSTITACTAKDNGDDGIYANSGSTITTCTATDNGDDGIYANSGSAITTCSAKNNGDDGIYANSGSVVSSCTASYNGGNGIYAAFGNTVSGCAASYNTAGGIQLNSDSLATLCVCDNNGYNGDGAGIYASGYDNRIDGNTVTDNDRGIDVDHIGNFIVKNTASGNSTNYNIVGGNDVGTIQTSPVGAGAWDNFEF